jgi:NADH-ubiquinone oxidoreductase chain 3
MDFTLSLDRTRVNLMFIFFLFAFLLLLFDLEILLVYPYVVSGYVNGIFGLIIMLLFFIILTLGFAFELGKNALSIKSK